MPDIYKSTDDSRGFTAEPLVASKVQEPSIGDKKDKSMMEPEMRMFWSFYIRPKGVSFETQDPEEEIILLLRKHPVTNLWWIATALLLFFAPGFFEVQTFIPFLPQGLYFIIYLVWYLGTMAFILESFLAWFFNVNIITDERVVDVDFHNLIHREISETKIDKIQDVSFSMGGVMSAVFNYGNVVIQTAGAVPNFDFTAVPEPTKVVKILQQLRNEEEQEAIEGKVR